MAAPSVTYTGAEVALLAGIIAGALPRLDEADFEVADLLLDKAVCALPQPIAPDLAATIERLRQTPEQRFRANIVGRFPPGQTFNIIDAAHAGGVRPSRAFMLLEKLATTDSAIRRDGGHGWVIAG